MRIKLLVALTVTVALVAAGCGEDDESTESSSEEAALTEAEFLEQGNAICEAGNQEIQEAGAALGQNATPDDLKAFVTDTLVPSIQGQIDDLGELVPPEELRANVDTLLADAESAIGELEADPAAVGQGGPDPFAEVNEQAKEIGLDACAG